MLLIPSCFFSLGNGTDTINKQPEADFIEGVVCQESDLEENDMKNFDLGDGKVLLVKQNGKISAIGTKCSHYGAFLSTGALGDGRVRCPWHGACFNLETGDIEDFPGQDSIPCYQVNIEQGQVKVRAKKSDLTANKRVKMMATRNVDDHTTFVVIGGGPSGATCVDTLRQNGFTGRIVMICKEPVLPYDRIKVSKQMDFDITKTLLRTQQFYDDNHIETMLNVEAIDLNSQTKEITLNNGYKIKYDKVYIATGSTPRKAPVPGAEFKNVITMRNHSDAQYVQSLLSKDKHVVVLGVSFIGLEAAGYCVKKVAKVTVVGRDSVPLRATFGEQIGAKVMKMFEENKVEFAMNNGIKRCIGTDGVLESVELNDGRILKADLCIMGIGSTLNTDFLKQSGLTLNRDGSIDTNQYLQSNVNGIYVGGDIANAPVYSSGNKLATIGHYPLSQYHGKIAALNMVDKIQELKVVPYFWTVLFGKSFRYTGHGKAHEVHIDGDLEALKFVAYYMDEAGKVIAMASCMRDPVVSQFAEYLTQGKSLHKRDIMADPVGWISLLNKA